MIPQRVVNTGEDVGFSENNSQVIDGMLSEISRLYVERFQSLRSGDAQAFQIADAKIAFLKIKLNAL